MWAALFLMVSPVRRHNRRGIKYKVQMKNGIRTHVPEGVKSRANIYMDGYRQSGKSIRK